MYFINVFISFYQYKNPSNYTNYHNQMHHHKMKPAASSPLLARPLTPCYLFVEQDVDDGVVEGGALGEEGRRRHEHGAELDPLVGKDVPGHAGVGHPAHQEGDDHDDHHAGHLPLRPLGGLRLLLLGGGLKEAGDRTVRGAVSHPGAH